jgi:GT2 family glycosyltransferase
MIAKPGPRESEREKLPRVTVYTITYNQRSILEQTVRDLCAQQYPPELLEVVIHDDGSTDGTAEFLGSVAREGELKLTVSRSAHERDYMSARRWNQCIAASSPATNILIQIDDVRMRPDFIRQHIKWHRAADNLVITGAKFEGTEETWELATCKRNALAGQRGAASRTNVYTAVWGASLSFTRKLMERVYQEPHELPYDERMEGWGYHEVEFAFRLQRAGGQLIYDPAAGVFHRDHTAASESRRGMERQRLVETGEAGNALYMMQKHGIEEFPWW